MISKFKKRLYITLNNNTWDYLEKKSSALSITKSEYIEMLVRKEVNLCNDTEICEKYKAIQRGL